MIIDDTAPLLDLDHLLDANPPSTADEHPEWLPTLDRLRSLDDDLAPPPGLKLQTWAALMATATAPGPVAPPAAPAAPPSSTRLRRHRRALVGFAAAAAAAVWLAVLVPLRPTGPAAPAVPRPPAPSSVASDVSVAPALTDVLPAAPEPAVLADPAGPPPPSRATARSLPRWAPTPVLPGVSLSSLTPTGLLGVAALGLDDAHRQIVARQAAWEADLAADQDALLEAFRLDDLVEAASNPSWFLPA